MNDLMNDLKDIDRQRVQAGERVMMSFARGDRKAFAKAWALLGWGDEGLSTGAANRGTGRR